MREGFAIAGLAFLAPGLAWTNVENRNLIPFGERELFTANTGTAGNRSTGAVYYNPAALAELDHPKISVFGSTYLSTDTKNDVFAVMDGSDLSYSSSGFDSIPATVISTTRIGSWNAAYFVLVPEILGLDNRQTFTTPNTKTTFIEVKQSNDMWIGLAAGGYVTRDLAFGFSISLAHHKESDAVVVSADFPGRNAFLSSATHFQASSSSIMFSFGTLYKVDGRIALGFRVSAPSVRLRGEAKGFSTQNSAVEDGFGAVAVDKTATEETAIQAQYRMPVDCSFGARWTPIESFTLLGDVSFQSGITYDPYPNSSFSKEIKTVGTFRGSVGAEWTLSKAFDLVAGFLYNPSSVASLEGREQGSSKLDYFGATAGFFYTYRQVRTGIGGFYLRGRGESIPFEGGERRSPFSQNSIGGALSVSYLL